MLALLFLVAFAFDPVAYVVAWLIATLTGNDFDFVKVLDFGLVKALNSSDDSDPVLTGVNAVHGTPSFIAPEQALGSSDLDGRVDIYSAGCVAYWLLTGQLVFTAETPMGLVMHHAHTIPTAPSQRTAVRFPKRWTS